MVQLGADELGSEFVAKIDQIPQIEILSGEGNAYYLRLEMGQLNYLASLDEVLWIQPFSAMKPLVMEFPENRGIHLMDSATGPGDYSDLTGFESGTKVLGFEEAWAKGYNGSGQIVSMADTGLDSGEVKTLIGDVRAQVLKGYSYGIGATNWSDPMGHGTHVAGSVLSNGDASGGLIRGGAFGAQMIPEGMWSPIIDNLTVPPKLAKLFSSAYADGARIHTNSWGGGQLPGAYDSYASQVDDFIWSHPDMLILFAAGNNGVDGNKDGRVDENSMASPGSAKNVLTVGASENLLNKGGIQKTLGELLNGDPWGVEPLKSDTLSNNPNGIAAFSSRGPCLDGRIKPDVVAPGTNIVSTCSTVKGASPLWGNYNPHYCYSGGTSMATPLVAGAAAVLRQYLNQAWNLPQPSAALMKAVLMNSADDLFPGQYGTGPGQELPQPAPNSHEGYGRVNIDRATSAQALEYYYGLIDQPEGVATGETWTQTVKVPGGPVKATLVYTDAPGAPNAKRALVNNLDLEMETVSPSQTSTDTDEMTPQLVKSTNTTDNAEQVALADVPAGEVIVRVTGVNVPKGRNGKQGFAVVISR